MPLIPHRKIQKVVIPAQAGIHRCDDGAVEEWIPAFAGMTIEEGASPACSS
jgi:hypothetical protein